MSFFDRLSNGWTIAMSSFKVLKDKKELIIFPILSGISIMLIVASFFFVVFVKEGWDPENNYSFRGSGDWTNNYPLTREIVFGANITLR